MGLRGYTERRIHVFGLVTVFRRSFATFLRFRAVPRVLDSFVWISRAVFVRSCAVLWFFQVMTRR